MIKAGITAMTIACAIAAPVAQTRGAVPTPAPERINYLTFAQGAIPVSVGGTGVKYGATWEDAVRVADGDPTRFTIVDQAPGDTVTEFVYELPARTTFDRFAVPNVLETPSPAQTFTKLVEVHGSVTSAADGFSLLASATLETHKARNQITELRLVSKSPAKWIKLRLAGAINLARPLGFLEFSEIIGNGTQEIPALVDHFRGAWQARGVAIDLQQTGPIVTGCYDTSGELTGTVTGNILRATGVNASDKTRSAFILSVAPDGSIRGVRSSNGAPFYVYTAPKTAGASAAKCPQPPPARLGCGSIIHGITFDFDSAVIRPESAPVLEQLFKGLSADKSQAIAIEGHTSSEGTDAYNQKLSEARARAVVDDLVKRGQPASRLQAAGLGETRPIAGNNDESGRSLNRRVEVRCQ